MDFGNGQRDFTRLQQGPSITGVFHSNSHLKIVPIETGEPVEYELGQKHISQQIGDLNMRDTMALSPNGRWLLSVPFAGKKMPRVPLLIDLPCLAKTKSKCVPVYRLESIYAQAEPQIAFDPKSKLLFIGETERKLLVYDIETALAAPKAFASQTIETPGAFTIMGFPANREQIVLMVNNGREAEPRELQIFHLGTPYGKTRYSLDADEIFWDNMNLKQALGGAYQVGMAGRTIYLWEMNPAPGFDLLYYPSNIGIDIGKATDATIAPDGKLIATAHPSGYVALWRLDDRTLIGVIGGLKGERVLIDWRGTLDKYALYAASQAGQLFKWMNDGTLDNLNVPHEVKAIKEFQVSKDGRTVAVHDQEGLMYVLTDERWIKLATTQETFALSADGRRLAVAQDNGSVSIMDLDIQRVTKLQLTELFLPCAADKLQFAMSDTRVVAEGCNGIVVWDSHGGSPLIEQREAEAQELSSKINVESTNELWARYSDGYTNIVNLRDGKILAKISWRPNPSLKKGTLLKIGGQPEGVETELGGHPTVFDFSQSTNLAAAGVASSEDRGTLQVWRLGSGNEVSYVPYSPNTRRVEFLPDGDALLIISPEGVPVIVPFDAAQQLRALCPFFWSKIDLKDDRAGGYKFCWNTFEQAQSGKTVQPPSVWVLQAAQRQP